MSGDKNLRGVDNMNRIEYCETICKHRVLVNGLCKHLLKAKKAQKVFGYIVVKKGTYYCNRFL